MALQFECTRHVRVILNALRALTCTYIISGSTFSWIGFIYVRLQLLYIVLFRWFYPVGEGCPGAGCSYGRHVLHPLEKPQLHSRGRAAVRQSSGREGTHKEVKPFTEGKSINAGIVYMYMYMNKTKILFGQLNCSVKLADVSTRCSSHPQGKRTISLHTCTCI